MGGNRGTMRATGDPISPKAHMRPKAERSMANSAPMSESLVQIGTRSARRASKYVVEVLVTVYARSHRNGS